MSVTPPEPNGDVLAQCDHLSNQLPDRLGGLNARKTAPASPLTFAWGSPAITLSCGVPRPSAYLPTSSQVLEVDGVRWFQQYDASSVTWTAIRPGSSPKELIYVALRVPVHYTASDSFLTQLAQPLKVALP